MKPESEGRRRDQGERHGGRGRAGGVAAGGMGGGGVAGSAYPESVQRLIDEFAKLPGIGRRSAERLAFHVLKTEAGEALKLAHAVTDVKRTVRHCVVCFNLADGPEVVVGRGTGIAPDGRLVGGDGGVDGGLEGGLEGGGQVVGLGDAGRLAAEAGVTVTGTAGGTTGGTGSGKGGVCRICASMTRDHSTVMVVEQPKDLIALEQTGMYKGVYHVLMGRISPLDGVGPGDVTIAELVARVVGKGGAGVVGGTGVVGAGGVREVVLALNPTLEADGTALYIAQELGRAAKGVRVTRLARGVPTGTQIEFANKAVLADAIEGRRGMEGDR